MFISKSASLCEFGIFVKNVHHVNLNGCIIMMNYSDNLIEWHILLQIVISFVHVGILIQKIEELGDCRKRGRI